MKQNSTKPKNDKTSGLPRARVCIYARYSSDMQNPSSASDQIDRIKYMIERKTLRLHRYTTSLYDLHADPNWILRDEAESGRTADRSGYIKLLKGIESRAFDVVIVDDLSRLTRSLGDQVHLYELLTFNKVELYSVCDAISSESPNANIHFAFKGMINQMGNEIHAGRTKRGQEMRVLKGYSSGDTCYGYCSKATQTRINGGREVPSHYEISVVEDEANVIRKIFDLKIKGLGYSAIAKYLNDQRIPSTTRGRKISGQTVNWSASLIRKVLTREKYIGVWQWGKQSKIRNPSSGKVVNIEHPHNHWVAHHEGKKNREDLIIVQIEKWEQVQALIKESTREYRMTDSKTKAMQLRRVTGASSEHLLAGILKCSECGSPFLQITGNKGGYYGCPTHHRKDATKCSNQRLINRLKIEQKIIEVVRKHLSDEDHIQRCTDLANQILRKKMRDNPVQLKHLRNRSIELDREIQNLIDFIAKGGEGSLAIAESLRLKEAERVNIKTQINHLQSTEADKLFLTPFSMREYFKKLSEALTKEPVLGNAAMRKLIPDGLICKPEGSSEKRNFNQNNSHWMITGKMLAGGPKDFGFSYLGNGGGGGN